MLSDQSIKEVVKQSGRIKSAELGKYVEQATKTSMRLGSYLIREKVFTEEELYRLASVILKVPFIDLEKQVIRKDILFLIPEPLAQSHEIVAFNQSPTELSLAATDPDDLQIFDFIEKKTNLKIKVYLALPRSVQEALKQYHLTLEAEFEKLGQKNEGEQKKDTEMLAELAEDLPVVRIVDSLIDHAIFENASDIHIEPSEKEVVVRYRVDGILKNVMVLPKSVSAGIVARIKILSNLKLDEHRLPQDGRFKISGRDYRYSLRVSIFPEMDGEKIVLRLLSETAKALTLVELGFLPEPLAIVKRNLVKPHGIIFVTGPTGSGKTTTLYSIVDILNKPGINIQTVEDPIEYRIKGVNQSQVNARIGFTFAAGLRSILRQDPNIIMVGEIRDPETADIALHAALTGHLVLSTLHTNDAVTSLPRLVQMGVPAFLVASTANMIIAQRLVRKICTGCKVSYVVDEKTSKELKRQFDIERVISLASKQKVNLPRAKGLTLYKGGGCKQCNNEGYKGRVGIYEVLEVTPKIQELISNNAHSEALLEVAREKGMMTILEDGLIKALMGVTTIEEVLRVTEE